eukprot:COSAG02_NODE_8821_length_2432_cov_2.569653_4_plen_120_part_00
METTRTYRFGRRTAWPARRRVLRPGRVLHPASTHLTPAVVLREAATLQRGSTPSSECAAEVAVDQARVVAVVARSARLLQVAALKDFLDTARAYAQSRRATGAMIAAQARKCRAAEAVI